MKINMGNVSHSLAVLDNENYDLVCISLKSDIISIKFTQRLTLHTYTPNECLQLVQLITEAIENIADQKEGSDARR